MRKTLILALAVLLVGALSATAQTAQKPAAPAQAKTWVGPNFVDANGDGICDHYQSGTRRGRMGAARGGYGPGDGTGNRGVGPNFVDANGDGVCDHYQAGARQGRTGAAGGGNGSGRGPRR
jgi:hypothetical protein